MAGILGDVAGGLLGPLLGGGGGGSSGSAPSSNSSDSSSDASASGGAGGAGGQGGQAAGGQAAGGQAAGGQAAGGQAAGGTSKSGGGAVSGTTGGAGGGVSGTTGGNVSGIDNNANNSSHNEADPTQSVIVNCGGEEDMEPHGMQDPYGGNMGEDGYGTTNSYDQDQYQASYPATQQNGQAGTYAGGYPSQGQSQDYDGQEMGGYGGPMDSQSQGQGQDYDGQQMGDYGEPMDSQYADASAQSQYPNPDEEYDDQGEGEQYDGEEYGEGGEGGEGGEYSQDYGQGAAY
jgi:hypothetical protein